MTKEILMNHKGGIVKVLVDDEDYALLNRHTWFVRSTSCGNNPYAATNLPRVNNRLSLLPMHYFIMGRNYVDHVNGNTLDNRRENLRGATAQENGWNKPKNARGPNGKPCSSQYKGVMKIKGDWVVRIKLTKKGVKPAKYIYGGPFKTELDGAMFYNKIIVKLRGKWAWVNPLPE